MSSTIRELANACGAVKLVGAAGCALSHRLSFVLIDIDIGIDIERRGGSSFLCGAPVVVLL